MHFCDNVNSLPQNPHLKGLCSKPLVMVCAWRSLRASLHSVPPFFPFSFFGRSPLRARLCAPQLQSPRRSLFAPSPRRRRLCQPRLSRCPTPGQWVGPLAAAPSPRAHLHSGIRQEGCPSRGGGAGQGELFSIHPLADPLVCSVGRLAS